MDYPAVTHEIWVEILDPNGTLYGESLIGVAYTDDRNRLVPHYAAIPMPGAATTLRPITAPDPEPD